MTAALFLGQHIHLTLELGVGLDAAGLAENLAALDFFLLGAAQEETDVVASLTLVEQLAEHFDARDDGLGGVAEADELALFTDLDDAALDTAGGNGAAARDGEDVFDREEEGLVGLAGGLGDPGVQSVVELLEVGDAFGVALDGLGGRAANDRGVAGEAVLLEKITDFHLDEVEQLGVVDEVALVEPDDDLGDVDLLGEQDVLAGLGHGAVGGGHDENRAVHLGGTGDHVLDVVGVARAVDVGVVTGFRLILDVAGGNGEDLGAVATTLALRSLGHFVIGHIFGVAKLVRAHLGESSRRRGLAMVHVANRAYVYMGLGAVKLFLGHLDLRLTFAKEL